MPSIAENLARVQDSIAAACRLAGRPRDEVELMAVSKTHPVDYLIEAARSGQVLFGENRVQEFAGKSTALAAAEFPVELHPSQAGPAPALSVNLIGHLQSNKAARAAELFTSVDTLDSRKLAERLNEAAAARARVLPVLIEIKLSHEPSKEGLAPASAELAALLERLPDLSSLAPRGLMTVAPIDENPAVARACFRELRLLRDTLAQRHPRLALTVLSMGMSGDFDAAIEEGSTQVRIGTAIFGARPRPAQ
jgi:pyridoxal phosphate enzyme (YggS family)